MTVAELCEPGIILDPAFFCVKCSAILDLSCWINLVGFVPFPSRQTSSVTPFFFFFFSVCLFYSEKRLESKVSI